MRKENFRRRGMFASRKSGKRVFVDFCVAKHLDVSSTGDKIFLKEIADLILCNKLDSIILE